jgi:hypothetical protein
MTERNDGMLLGDHRDHPLRRCAGRAAYWCWFLVVLVVLAVANGGSAQLLGDDLDGGPALGSPRSSPQAQASPGVMYL